MNPTTTLIRGKEGILAELAKLGPMRKGSLSEQYVDAVGRDGTKRRRGPYTLYTFKEKGRTVSRRLRGAEQVARYREQIAAFRRFQELTGELARVGQRLADLEAAGGQEEGCKKNSRR